MVVDEWLLRARTGRSRNTSQIGIRGHVYVRAGEVADTTTLERRSFLP